MPGRAPPPLSDQMFDPAFVPKLIGVPAGANHDDGGESLAFQFTVSVNRV